MIKYRAAKPQLMVRLPTPHPVPALLTRMIKYRAPKPQLVVRLPTPHPAPALQRTMTVVPLLHHLIVAVHARTTKHMAMTVVPLPSSGTALARHAAAGHLLAFKTQGPALVLPPCLRSTKKSRAAWHMALHRARRPAAEPHLSSTLNNRAAQHKALHKAPQPAAEPRLGSTMSSIAAELSVRHRSFRPATVPRPSSTTDGTTVGHIALHSVLPPAAAMLSSNQNATRANRCGTATLCW